MPHNTSSFLDSSISTNLLPNFFRTVSNKNFLHSTLDQLIQPGVAKKLNGFIGQQDSKASVGEDIFIEAANKTRQNYQLEPALVIKDESNTHKLFKDYQDYINQLNLLGANVTNHSRLNEQEFYSWNPHICWDKFKNFQNYYWVPDNEELTGEYDTRPVLYTIEIESRPSQATSTYEITTQTQGTSTNYIFGLTSALGGVANPTITLFRGHTYIFEVNCQGSPISIKTSRALGAELLYLDGVSASFVDRGVIEFTVPLDAPDTLYYQSEIDLAAGGQFRIFDYDTIDVPFNVETDLVGKKTCFLGNIGRELSNGMKVRINDETYFVEGVGNAITPVSVDALQLLGKNLDFVNNTTDISQAVYVVIGRASQTYNQWSRYNRWFHKDVITESANYTGKTVNLSQLYRAARPIIEFNGQLQLFNYGNVFVDDVDLYDEFSTNLQEINGKLGYYIDKVEVRNIIESSESGIARVLSKKENCIYNIKKFNQRLSIESIETPSENQVVLVKCGELFKDTAFHCKLVDTQLVWVSAQSKIISNGINQPPFFDVFGQISSEEFTSFSDLTVYADSDFDGSKIFSYKINEAGVIDPILQLRLSYKTIENSGDIVFGFDFDTNSFNYIEDSIIYTNAVNTGFLRKNTASGGVFVNCWEKAQVASQQAAIRIYKNTGSSASDEDKVAKPYSPITVYYSGNIVRDADNNLYQARTDGAVLPTGIVGVQPLLDITNSIWQFYSKSSLTLNNFALDLFDDKNNLTDLIVQVYINSIRVPEHAWQIQDGVIHKIVVLDTPVNFNDVVTIKAYSKQPINDNGYYQIPINLQQNPNNQLIDDLTYGEILDHIRSMIDNYSLYNPEYAESIDHDKNLRDFCHISSYGSKFVQHSGALSLPLYHITSSTNNIIKAIEKAAANYVNFKKNFVAISETLGVDTDVVSHVNLILQELNKNTANTTSYSLSDMLAYRSFRKTNFTVIDHRIKTYPLTVTSSSIPFDLSYLSDKAVYIYLNGEQLCYGVDYTFNSQGFVFLTIEIAINDTISIYEYDTTDESFIPETPTKLGLWPKYQPKKYLDTTLVTPRYMIQGHDGSLMLAYGDYRDNLLLELEKRIFNNIKIEYNPDIFDIQSFIPSYNKITPYSLDEFNQILSLQFYKWAASIGQDFGDPINFDENNQFTFNYTSFTTLDGRLVPGYWRGIYQWMLGTDRPHICPWEMLGFSEEPSWWTSVYGTAPYTSQNILMWNDISHGIFRDPNKPIRQDTQFIRDFLLDHIPVDDTGRLIGPLDAGLVNGLNILNSKSKYKFGDQSPVETAWRRSSYYSFSVIIAALLSEPAKVLGLSFDRSRLFRSVNDQLVYDTTNQCLSSSNVVLPSTTATDPRVYSAGLVNYIVNYIIGNSAELLDSYQYDLKNMQFCLSHRLSGFTSKDKLNLLLDNRSPLAASSVFVPKEDYDIFLNSSSPVGRVEYSGVIITKLPAGFEVKGYSKFRPFFKYYQWTRSGPDITVGGISEGYLTWSQNETYPIGKIIEYNNKFYRVKSQHNSGDNFNSTYYQAIASLPIIGGKTANLRTTWDRTDALVLPYGTILNSSQAVIDFLLGYGEWLIDQGVIFDQFNSNSNQALTWETSAKEFLFWTTQNWTASEDIWSDWEPNVAVQYNTIIQYNGEYYRAERNVPSTIDEIPVFPDEYDQYSSNDTQYYEKLNGLSTVGSAVISLSPLASQIKFSTNLCVVNDIRDQFYDYEILSVNGAPINPKSLIFNKDQNTFSYSVKTDEAIYSAVFYLIQQEQVLTINNSTIFNDLIYRPETGHRQPRIKVTGHISTDWDGSFNTPGFIYDQAKVNDWIPWTDYVLGDMVKYKERYYSAKSVVRGALTFDESKWTKLSKIPTSKLIPNWSYNASQFTDFHNFDSDTFNTEQQQLAQHLIGFQKRQYLTNIIKDSVSELKFYQGMITEKGTKNVFNKLFDALSSNDQDSIDFYEEWALRVGQYGASSAYNVIEFILNEDQFKGNPQGFALVNIKDTTSLDFIIRQAPVDVYVKPTDYNSAPFPLAKKYKSALNSTGAVRDDDVQFIFRDLDEVIQQDIDLFTDGDYIWCLFTFDDWEVYKFSLTNYISDITQFDNELYVVSLMFPTNLQQGRYIGLLNLPQGSGFYKIEEVVSSYAFKVKRQTASPFILPFNYNYNARYVELAEQRVEYFDSLATPEVAFKIYPKKLVRNNLVWVEGDTDIPWSTWEYKPTYSKDIVWNGSYSSTINFGNNVAIDKQELNLIVTDYSRKLTFYNRSNSSFRWIFNSVINLPSVYPLNEIGNQDKITAMALSDDGYWLAVSVSDTNNTRVSLVSGLYLANDNPLDSSAFISTSQGLVFLYEKRGLAYQLLHVISSPQSQNIMATDEKFGFSLAFNENTLYIGAPEFNSTTKTGVVYSLVYTNNSWNYGVSYSGDTGFYNFGHSLSVNSAKSLLAVSAPNPGRVYIFSTNGNNTMLRIENPQPTNINLFGTSISLATFDYYIAISSSHTLTGRGVVSIYRFDLDTQLIIHEQDISRLVLPEVPGFGDKIAFIENYNPEASSKDTLIIYDGYNIIGYDAFTYDTVFYDNEIRHQDTSQLGLIGIYDRYFNKWVLSESVGNAADGAFGIAYGQGFSVGRDSIIVGAPNATNYQYITSGQVYEYSNKSIERALSWVRKYQEKLPINVYKIKKAFLYDKTQNLLVSYLDVIDNAQGKIPGIADQEIKYKTYYDPAVYNDILDITSETYESKIINKNIVTIDNGRAWGKLQTGTLWWNLKTVKFVNIYDRDVVYRNGFQNALAPGASVDIYEWVESKYVPEEWDALADTEEGHSLGISGTSLYENDVYCVSRTYDNISQTYTSLYYFWVKNKKTIPSNSQRTLSSYTVSNLISNPRGQNYQYITITGVDSFSLVNVAPLLSTKDVVLSIEYWIVDQTNQNIHSEWQLISNDSASRIPKNIEQKWFDSLVGRDRLGLPMPDQSLPKKLMYGIENRPRQSMFINRFEALKQLVEHANLIFKRYQIAEHRNLSKLYLYDTAPTQRSLLYDRAVDTLDDLLEVSVNSFRQALLSPVIVDGRVVNVTIVDGGTGYQGTEPYTSENGDEPEFYGPTTTITGTGVNASVTTVINQRGTVHKTIINSSGEGYSTNTRIAVRSYSVLVRQDASIQNTWSIYSYNIEKSRWDRSISQAFDIRKYWTLIDWYAAGYSQFTIANYAVDIFSELLLIDSKVGELIKVRQPTNGKWVLLRRSTEYTSINWTDMYQVVGIGSGTIQLTNKLYDFGETVGYSGTPYDVTPYDSIILEEIRYILEALRDDILIDDLRTEYLNLFFIDLRYALSEQHYLDWAFKTSLIKVKHNVGELDQRITYKNDNLANFEEYIEEVKPYRTKVREYVSSYARLEACTTSVSDFDLPLVVEQQRTTPIMSFIDENSLVKTSHDELMATYPWKHWYDNCLPELSSVTVTNGGSGYNLATTQVAVIGDCVQPAIVEVQISNGVIVAIDIVDPGKGYRMTPVISITSSTGVGAVATATIKSRVRSTLTSIKFDRISPDSEFNQLFEVEEFGIDDSLSPSNQAIFKLKYVPDSKIGQIIVMVNDQEIYQDSYDISAPITTSAKEYITPYVTLSIKNATTGELKELLPTDQVSIKYYINASALSAVDRITYFYEPESGSPGKDLGQLLLGYNDTSTISGLDFLTDYGWDSMPFYTRRWDSTNQETNDIIVEVTANDQYLITLPYAPAAGQSFNVYYAKKYSSNVTSNGTDLLYYFDNNVRFLRVHTVYTTTGSQEAGLTSIILANTSNINIGDSVTSTSLVHGEVTSINVDQTLTVSNVEQLELLDPIRFTNVFGGIDQNTIYYVDSIDANNITLRTIKNLPESIVTELTAGVGSMNYEIGDYFAYDTVVVEKSESVVTLSRPTIRAIPDNLMIDFTRILVEPNNVIVYNNGVFKLFVPIPAGVEIFTTGYYRMVQLDNIVSVGGLPIISSHELNNVLVSSELINFKVGAPIIFSGSVFGGIVPNVVYFVHSIVNDYSFRVSNTLFGVATSLETDTGTMTVNPLMTAWESDGISNTVSIPSELPLNIGDQVILRNTRSDGAIAAYHLDYDTTLDGGDISYLTATGVDPTSIIVDGIAGNSGTVSLLEEVFPGHTSDAVAIKVYETAIPNSESHASIKVDRYIANGTQTVFSISQKINSPDSVFVKTTAPYGIIELTEHNVPVTMGDIINSNNNFGRVTSVDQNTFRLEYELVSGEYFSVRDQITLGDDVVGTVLNALETNYEIINSAGLTYTVDFDANTIVFVSPPISKTTVSIFSFGVSDSMIDVEYLTADGVLDEFDTKIPYTVLSYYTPIVYVNGVVTSAEFAQSTNGGLRVKFNSIFAENTAIAVVSAKTDNILITRTERFVGNSGHDYYLTQPIGTYLPYAPNIFVRVGQEILMPPKVVRFTIGPNPITGAAQIYYYFDPNEFTIGSIVSLSVMIDDVLLGPDDYTVNDFIISTPVIKISFDVYAQYLGKTLVVLPVTETYDYMYVPGEDGAQSKITLSRVYDETTDIEVTVSYKHEILAIQRDQVRTSSITELAPNSVLYHQYMSTRSGLIKLTRAIKDENYVWVTQNRKLLTPVIDYKLNEDKSSIQLSKQLETDAVFDVITFDSTDNTIIAYMQFKDMLNRTHFKRLNRDKQTRLAKELHFNDISVVVEHAGMFDIPDRSTNKPGVIYIQGERIEYFSINGNSLSQLRRGTLGTSIATVYPQGTEVQEIGPTETIPYTDTVIIEKLLHVGSDQVALDNINNIILNDTIYKNAIVGNDEQLKIDLAAHSIEVAVDGYAIFNWTPNNQYVVDDIIRVNTNTYICIESHTSDELFSTDIACWQLFNSKRLLNSNSYSVHHRYKHPDSPEGDVVFDADYTADNSNNIVISDQIPVGTPITVRQRTGLDWDGITSIQDALADESIEKQRINKIAKFITLVPGSAYTTQVNNT